MFISCPCLNISIAIAEKSANSALTLGHNNLKLSALSDVGCYEALEFLKAALGPIDAPYSLTIQHEALVLKIQVDKWNVNNCVNCDSFCFATAGDLLLINGNLLRDEAQLNSLKDCDKYSMPFKIILKPIDGLPRAFNSSINDDARIRSLYEQLQDFIARDTTQTEAEIRRLTQEMNQRRQQAEKDFQRIAALIESSTNASTKSLSNENIGSLTPPVTPESINDKMAIDDHAQQLPQPKMIPNAKHSNAINSVARLRTIDFDDDIFDMDGMQEGAANDVDRYHKYSDTDEGSDGERSTEKRPTNRGRSGSINFARSAPISMPQFNHHALHAIDVDIKPVGGHEQQQQMDIASSIKMLARSIHADSIFGELPARPVRYNAEF